MQQAHPACGHRAGAESADRLAPGRDTEHESRHGRTAGPRRRYVRAGCRPACARGRARAHGVPGRCADDDDLPFVCVDMPPTLADGSTSRTVHSSALSQLAAVSTLASRPPPVAVLPYRGVLCYFDRPGVTVPQAEVKKQWPDMFSSVDCAAAMSATKAVIFSGCMYQRFDIVKGRVDAGYPRVISHGWDNMPFARVDLAVNWGNGKLYFICGDLYVRFDLYLRRCDANYPRHLSAGRWLEMMRLLDPRLNALSEVDWPILWGHDAAYAFRRDGSLVRYDMSSVCQSNIRLRHWTSASTAYVGEGEAAVD